MIIEQNNDLKDLFIYNNMKKHSDSADHLGEKYANKCRNKQNNF
jgi:hypothetical protein